MATPGISAPTDGRVRIRDEWLNDNAADGSAVVDCVNLTPRDAFANTAWFSGKRFVATGGKGNNGHFEPRAILVDSDTDGQATVATVRGCLRNEGVDYPSPENYTMGNLHPVRYRFIYALGTSARGIKLHM